MNEYEYEYKSKKEVLKILGISPTTLLTLAEKNKIEFIKTLGGHRKYNIKKYLNDNKIKTDMDVKNEKEEEKILKDKISICYVRVSTAGQKDDLVRQKEYMKEKYPNHLIIEDIGSGINFNRKGFRKIIKLGIEGKIKELVVAYKDRLTRFGYSLIEDLIKEYSNGSIVIETNKEEKDKENEIVEDVLNILNVYTAKINGMRKYKK
ncbi:IS607 family transposase [bacterium]|nr:IS607 family transposase [bacterium]